MPALIAEVVDLGQEYPAWRAIHWKRPYFSLQRIPGPVTTVSIVKLFLPTFAIVLATVYTLQSMPVRAEPLSRQRQNELINMVKHDCGSCHGLTLKGGLGPPLTRDAVADKPHGLLFNAIMQGRENTAMPPWKELLTRQEIDWLVSMLKNGLVEDREKSSE